MCVLVKNALLHRCLHFPHCWSAFYHPVGCAVTAVICRTTAVTWFGAVTNQRHSAFSIPHFTFRIPQFHILPTARYFTGVALLMQQINAARFRQPLSAH